MSLSALSEIASGVGIVTLSLFIAAKVFDFSKNSDVRKAVMSLFKAKKPEDIAKKYLNFVEVIIDALVPANRAYKKVIISMNSSLIVSIALIAEQATRSLGSEKKAKTIVGMMLGEKLKRTSRAQFFLILSLFSNFLFTFFIGNDFSDFILLICGLGLFAIHIDHKLIEYRVKKGWYGKNEFESREIIYFILSHVKKDDFNDQGGLKKIIPTPEKPEEKSLSSNLGENLA